MNGPVGKLARCAIYTRKSSEHNLDLAFSSLDAQREACEAYIKSQAHDGRLPSCMSLRTTLSIAAIWSAATAWRNPNV